MSKGAVIFAHNNRKIDYALLAVISGGLAKKNLDIPVSLITDDSTIAWMQESNLFSKAVKVFENVIINSRPETDNVRKLNDGQYMDVVPFINTNRSSIWDLTPYDKTLLIDSDYFIFSDNLNNYWDVDQDLMISDSINDIYDQKRLGYHDRYISDTGVHLYWATTVMFNKNEKTKSFFDMVQFVRDNYQYYADLFRFDSKQYRNDIAFSVAKHIMDGFKTDISCSLPPILTTIDKDILHSIDDDGKLTFLITPNQDSNYCPASMKGIDLHIMNKQSIIRNADSLLNLI